MDPQIKAISGRRRSSVISSGDPPSPSPSSPASLITPRKASTWDSPAEPPPPSDRRTASDISSRRSSAVTPDVSARNPEYSGAGSFAGRKASAWGDPPPPQPGGGAGVSASNIAGRRATEMDRPPWDVFSGAPPDYVGSTWAWISEISAMTSVINPTSSVSEKNRVFYVGNIEYIFKTYKDQNLANGDFEAIMYSYGVDETSARDILNKVDPQKRGIFNLNAHNKQILLTSNTDFSQHPNPKEALSNLKQASKCLEKNLLSPLHFAGYIIHILKGRYVGNEPPFMILGIYSILGVLGRSNDGLLTITTKDVETFMGLWRVLDPDEARDFIHIIDEDFNGKISSFDFYNLLYRRNLFGKQRIQMFDIKGLKDPSLFFPLMDKDGDGFLSAVDLRSFAAIFDRYPSDEAINNATRKLDLDGDGKINREDFRQAMVPILDGITWEFWLVAILYVLEL